jgi:hypothetical protein
MITYIRISPDKKYLSIDVDTEPTLKIHLKGDVIMSKSDNRIEYIITETNCRILLIRHPLSTSICTIGQMEIHSDSMSFIDRYEDDAEDEGDDINTQTSLLARAIELYKQEG